MVIIKILWIYQIFLIVESAKTKSSILIDIENRSFEVATRIVGGESADIKNYPFAVSIQYRLGSKHNCGGTYILPKFVLSAAHCMIRYNGFFWYPDNPRLFLVLAGTTNLWYTPTWQIVGIDEILPHPDFVYSTMAHDIGLFKIAKPFRLTPYVNYAPIPHNYDNVLFSKNQSTCTVIGWGKLSESSTMTSDILQQVDVPLISPQNCARFFLHNLHKSQLCAGKEEGGVDACQGDSGGPLICNGFQVGIVSWGHGCAAPNSPGVYCRVDHYLDWIKQIASKNDARHCNARFDVLLIGLFIIYAKKFSHLFSFILKHCAKFCS